MEICKQLKGKEFICFLRAWDIRQRFQVVNQTAICRHFDRASACTSMQSAILMWHLSVCPSVRPSVTLWYKPLRRLAYFVRILQVARLNDVVVIRMRRRQIPDNVDF